MKKSYTIQFEYNGQTVSRCGMRDDFLKADKSLEYMAYTLVASVIENENLYVEGQKATKIRLMGKDMELLWSSED